MRLSLFSSKQCIIKQLLDSVFVISGIIKISVSVISLSLRLPRQSVTVIAYICNLVVKTYKIQLAVTIFCCCVYQSTVQYFQGQFYDQKYRDLYTFLSSNSSKFNVKYK